MLAQCIDCITTERDASGRRRITHVSGTSPAGGRWRLSREDALRAVRRGTVYYVTFEAESHMVTAENLAEADSSMLLRLPECRPGAPGPEAP
jgi:hypothetical protein